MSRLLIAKAFCVLSLAGLVMPAAKKIAPPKREELITAWIGVTEDELYMFRLELTGDARGRLAYAFLDSEPRVFPVLEWTLTDRTFALSVGPDRSGPGTVVSGKGRATGAALSLVLEGGDWRRRAEFRREDGLGKRWKELRRAMGEGAP